MCPDPQLENPAVYLLLIAVCSAHRQYASSALLALIALSLRSNMPVSIVFKCNQQLHSGAQQFKSNPTPLLLRGPACTRLPQQSTCVYVSGHKQGSSSSAAIVALLGGFQGHTEWTGYDPVMFFLTQCCWCSVKTSPALVCFSCRSACRKCNLS